MTVTAYETWEENGKVGIRNADGKSVLTNNVAELLHFLRYSSSQTIRVVWELDATIAPILRLLPPEILDRLSKFDENLEYDGNELYYLASRMVRCGKSRYYAIRDFWGSLTDNKPDLKETQKRAEELIDTLAKIGLPNPRKLTSPIAVFEDSEYGHKLYGELPKGIDITEEDQEILEYASRADGKDWVSNYYVGHFGQGEIFDYDVRSCYPAIACSLPDMRDLTYWSTESLGDRERAALLGVACGRLSLNDSADCSPIIGMVGELPGNPLGDLPEDCYTIQEINFILNNKLGTFQMVDGWFAEAKPGVTPRLPFKNVMTVLYRKRAISPLAGSITKSIANSLVGKLIETKVSGEYGVLRNDLYHATITSSARVQVAQFLLDNQVRADELVCVQTDGVKLTRDIKLSDGGMGCWVNKGSSPTIVFSPYKVYSKDAKPYRLTYADVIGMINDHPLSERYEKKVSHRLTLVQAIRQHNDASLVGTMLETPDSIDLIALDLEQNRLYRKLPHTGKALISGKYRSEPIVS